VVVFSISALATMILIPALAVTFTDVLKLVPLEKD